eukprot:5536152-Amphidinium_carterae.1
MDCRSFLLAGQTTVQPSSHPAVNAMNNRVHAVACMVLHLMKNCFRSWSVDQVYPMKLARFLELEDKTQALASFKADWERWNRCQDYAGATWKSFRQRSVFNLMVVQKLVQECIKTEWKWTSSLEASIMELFQSFGQSNVVEMSVNISKASANKARNNTMSSETRYLSLIEGLDQKYFDYKPLNYEAMAAPRGLFNSKAK